MQNHGRIGPFAVVVAMLGLLVFGCAQSAAAPTTAPQKTAAAPSSGQPAPAAAVPQSIKGARLSIAGGSSGSASYVRMVGWSQVLNQELGTEISVETSGGAAATPKLIQDKAVDIASSYEGLIRDAYLGQGWSDTKHSDLRALFPFGYYLIQFYTQANSNIRSIKDFGGKKITLSKAGAGVDAYVRKILPAIGVTPSQIVNVDPSSATDLLKEGQVDACGVMGYYHPTIIQAASTMDVAVFGIDPALGPQINKVLPTLLQLTLPPNVYQGQTKELVTLGDPELGIVNKDMPEDLAYWIVKTTFQNADKMGKLDPSFEVALKDPSRIESSPIPLHKGAYRYYKEIGISVPDSIIPKD